jgi:NAD(P)-dependent dehydrogenase (short-subunit alcohol dehydrogenase family)
MALKYTNKLHNKRVLVLGGTSGIGFCVAEACVEYGAIVTVASSRQAKIDKTIQRLTTSYPDAKDRIFGQTCDLASEDVEGELKRMFKFATKDGKLDHVVNTAGDPFGQVKLADITSAQILKLGNVRYVGMLLMAKLAPDHMNVSSASTITSTGGVIGTKPSEGWSAVAGWSSAKEGMVRGLAVDLKPIRVNCVCPGAIDTELFDTIGGGGMRDQLTELFKEKTLLKKVGKPEDMAEAYLYLMRDTFVTGTTLLSDGGYVLV